MDFFSNLYNKLKTKDWKADTKPSDDRSTHDKDHVPLPIGPKI